jgi:hypothetical protein
LRECLQSLAAQTFRNFELVLIDMSGGLASTIVEGMRENLPALRRLELNGACSRWSHHSHRALHSDRTRFIAESFDFEQGFRHTLSRHACKAIP